MTIPLSPIPTPSEQRVLDVLTRFRRPLTAAGLRAHGGFPSVNTVLLHVMRLRRLGLVRSQRQPGTGQTVHALVTHPTGVTMAEATQAGALLRSEVLRFALLMEHQLRKHDAERGSGGWRSDPVWDLMEHLTEEVRELGEACAEAMPRRLRVGAEAADVSNMAMMVADQQGALPTLESLIRSLTADSA